MDLHNPKENKENIYFPCIIYHKFNNKSLTQQNDDGACMCVYVIAHCRYDNFSESQ